MIIFIKKKIIGMEKKSHISCSILQLLNTFKNLCIINLEILCVILLFNRINDLDASTKGGITTVYIQFM